MSAAPASSPSADSRLPTDVNPSHYDLTVRTDLVNLNFDGFVKIHLDVKKETSTIVFNTKDLILSDVTLYSDTLDVDETPISTSFDTAQERGSATFMNALPAGSKAQLKISFEGQLTGSMSGYYRSLGGTDKKEVYSLTHFAAASARKAFPCWDEPSLKASFTVTLISRADTVNLSNMPAVSETLYEPEYVDDTDVVSWLSKKLSALSSVRTQSDDQWKITRFDRSPLMSTYLVAYANGRFEYLETSYTSPLSGTTRPLRMYATSDIIDQAHFALDIKRRVLPMYEQAFEIEYPLPKLDTLVATDFDAGAMENWGLITGRTTAFLLDPKAENLAVKKWVAGTMCHEVGHMWFGNITTMEWWDNLYLNEGFATLMANVTVLDKVFPEWKLDATFISHSLAEALDLDAKLSSHPIEVECPDANMVEQIFDTLSYHKAASVLRMLSFYVGEERFLKGVSIYLKKHLYANSVTKDLWDGISEATGLNIAKMMDSWTKKIGFPVVTVTELDDGILVRQDRFLETGPAELKDNETIWSIPLTLLTVSDDGEPTVNRDIVLDERERKILVDLTRPFKLNAGTVSFYRVLYTTERLVLIGVEASKLPSPFSMGDRIGLVYDALALAQAGFSTVSSALSLIDVLRNESEFAVWESILSNLATLRSVWWEYPDLVEVLSRFEQGLVQPIVKRLGYDSIDEESADVRALRASAITSAAAVKEQSVVQELAQRFARYMKTGDDIHTPADLILAIYQTAVFHGGREEWEAVKQIIETSKNPTLVVRAIVAMGNTQDAKLAEETFQYMMTDSRDQDVRYYFIGLSRNSVARKFLVEAFKDNYDMLHKRLEGNSSMQFLVKLTFSELSTDKDYEETSEFFKDKDTSKYDMTLNQTLENIASRTAWIKRSTTDLQQWAKAQKNESGL